MRNLPFHQRPRSLGAQRARMAGRWPDFELSLGEGSFVRWTGPLQPLQRIYVVSILWDHSSPSLPYVLLEDPALEPRPDRPFAEIPHLLMFENNPARSGLCLFDPDGGEWSNRRLIADTTVPWAAHWLFHYELWHVDGIWRGGGVGPESIAAARAASLHGSSLPFAENATKAAAVAAR